MTEDWQGNKIEGGQTIVIVQTRPSVEAGVFGFLHGDDFIKLGPDEEQSNYIWEVLEEHKIWKDSYGILMCTVEENNCMISMRLSIMKLENEVLCIKGLSDSEKDYYTYYFNNN